jgi:hypothetical protein
MHTSTSSCVKLNIIIKRTKYIYIIITDQSCVNPQNLSLFLSLVWLELTKEKCQCLSFCLSSREVREGE